MNNEQLVLKIAMVVGVWLGSLLLVLMMFYSVSYKITEKHLVIRVLGIPIRWIRIRDIRHMGTDSKVWAERWYNTFSPLNRRLVIRRKKGLLCRTLIITPKNPYAVMNDLEKAKEKLKAEEAKSQSAGSRSFAGV